MMPDAIGEEKKKKKRGKGPVAVKVHAVARRSQEGNRPISRNESRFVHLPKKRKKNDPEEGLGES